MLGTGAAAFKAPPRERTEPEKHTRELVIIRALLIALVVIHVGLFIVAVYLVARGARAVHYYGDYLHGPLSGPNVAQTIVHAQQTLTAVRNITSLAATGSAMLASGLGAPPAPALRRTLLEAPPPPSPPATLATDEPDDDVRGALVSLLHSIRDKVTELDPRVPADFVAWLVALDFAPFVIDTLALVRYGEAQMSTVLRAFGTPVDASMVPDPAKILNR